MPNSPKQTMEAPQVDDLVMVRFGNKFYIGRILQARGRRYTVLFEDGETYSDMLLLDDGRGSAWKLATPEDIARCQRCHTRSSGVARMRTLMTCNVCRRTY